MRVIPLSRGNVASATKGLPSGYGFAEGDRAVSIALRQYTLIRPIRKANCPPSPQGIAHLPHKGEGFLLSNVWFIAEGDPSTSFRFASLRSG